MHDDLADSGTPCMEISKLTSDDPRINDNSGVKHAMGDLEPFWPSSKKRSPGKPIAAGMGSTERVIER